MNVKVSWLFYDAVLTVELVLSQMIYDRLIVNNGVGEIWVKEVLTCFVVLFLEGLMNTAMEK
jgi:hypothetical protein